MSFFLLFTVTSKIHTVFRTPVSEELDGYGRKGYTSLPHKQALNHLTVTPLKDHDGNMLEYLKTIQKMTTEFH